MHDPNRAQAAQNTWTDYAEVMAAGDFFLILRAALRGSWHCHILQIPLNPSTQKRRHFIQRTLLICVVTQFPEKNTNRCHSIMRWNSVIGRWVIFVKSCVESLETLQWIRGRQGSAEESFQNLWIPSSSAWYFYDFLDFMLGSPELWRPGMEIIQCRITLTAISQNRWTQTTSRGGPLGVFFQPTFCWFFGLLFFLLLYGEINWLPIFSNIIRGIISRCPFPFFIIHNKIQ